VLVVSSKGIPVFVGVTMACTVTCSGKLLFRKYSFLNWLRSSYEIT
jgi:hypothetical protein